MTFLRSMGNNHDKFLLRNTKNEELKTISLLPTHELQIQASVLLVIHWTLVNLLMGD